MEHFAFATFKELAEALNNHLISPRELVAYYSKRFEQHDKRLGSALEIFDSDSLLAQFPEKEDKENKSILWGIPGLIKDNICQKGRITSCASKILENYRASYDATVVTKLRAHGALSLGRANCDEFAMGSSTETSAFKKTANPWDITRVPGGSSGGSAAAVAAGLIPWALGSETGGSVRQPAALTGIVGFKPTYGLVSRYGLVAYASSIDQIGALTRTVYDNAVLLSTIAGQDIQDGTSLNVTIPDYTKELTGKIKPGLKIGVVTNTLEMDGFDPDIRAALDTALEQFKKLGAQLVPVTLPMMDHAAAVYFIVSRAEAASNLARFDGVKYGYRAPDVHTLSEMYEKTRAQGFGHIVKQRILIGNYVLSVGHADQYYNSAKKVQAMLRAQFLEAFNNIDLLFVPTSPIPAFKFNAFADNTLMLDLQDYFTSSANLAGIPAIAVPCGFTSQKLPIGFQLYGPDLSEGLLYQTAYAYEQSTEWHTMHPPEFC